ncbi:MAG: restriction endonuclease [Kiritimatiellae bacterium]|jgi:type II restriction enzyme|nr:restriction endonuclease [Kiritimatiellia bacterium]
MKLTFNIKKAEGYSNKSQIARVLTENWVKNNGYCPNCGEITLTDFENNKPVADFYCNNCKEEFELKSKNGKLSSTITDGAYSTMIDRINSDNNPNFFLLTYSKQWSVDNFLIIPKHFFTKDIIIERPPLNETARRAGWIGCNIDISRITNAGKIFLVKNSQVINPNIVKEAFEKTLFLREKKPSSKGWILDVMRCIDRINKTDFSLEEVYVFEKELKIKYPNNNFVKDKIRQQLQILRDKGIIEFAKRGNYRKIEQ